MYHTEFHERVKTPLTICIYLHWFRKYLKFEKWVKYANEMTDDIIHSTQYYIEYTNRVGQFGLQTIVRLVVLQEI